MYYSKTMRKTNYKEKVVVTRRLYLQNILQRHIEDLCLKARHACRATTRIMFFGPKTAETIQNVQFLYYKQTRHKQPI